jgi:hypothetical protein
MRRIYETPSSRNRLNCSAYPRIENKNILVCQKRSLVVIDPPPCIGDPADDAGYWAASAPPGEAHGQRHAVFAEALDLDP